jgi:hypothetical protein
MRTSSLVLLLAFAASCAAVPNPDRRAWSSEAPALPELSEPAAPRAQDPAPPPTEVTHMEVQRAKPQASRIWVLLGGRQLDDDFAPADDQGVLGLEYSYEGSSSIVGFEVGLMGSYKEETFANVGVGELYGGLRKTFRRGARFQPYVGGGISLANVRTDPLFGNDEDDSTVGGYGHGGFAVLLGKSFHLGLDIRALFGTDVTLAGTDTNVNYTQAALVLGWLL